MRNYKTDYDLSVELAGSNLGDWKMLDKSDSEVSNPEQAHLKVLTKLEVAGARDLATRSQNSDDLNDDELLQFRSLQLFRQVLRKFMLL